MIFRLMGEIDVHSFRADSLLLEQPVISNVKMPDGISDSDMINWLGWALDSGAATRLEEDEEFRGQVETAGRYLTGLRQPGMKDEQFIMLLFCGNAGLLAARLNSRQLLTALEPAIHII